MKQTLIVLITLHVKWKKVVWFHHVQTVETMLIVKEATTLVFVFATQTFMEILTQTAKVTERVCLPKGNRSKSKQFKKSN